MFKGLWGYRLGFICVFVANLLVLWAGNALDVVFVAVSCSCSLVARPNFPVLCLLFPPLVAIILQCPPGTLSCRWAGSTAEY